MLNLADRYKRRGYSSTEFTLRMTREEIGSYLGLKLETISRLFSRFQRQGLLQVQGRVVIHDEHRSLAAVLHGMLYLVRQIRSRHAKPDFAVLGAMVNYIDAFPERFHHPKEDAYLFKPLRRRDPNASELLDRLESDHRRGAEMIRALEQSLARYQQGGGAEFPAFAEAATAYAAFHWDHMRAEEDRLIPMARTHLTEDDWDVIDAAFAGHTDPLFGENAGAEYDALFRRIVNLAPAPIGLGPPH